MSFSLSALRGSLDASASGVWKHASLVRNSVQVSLDNLIKYTSAAAQGQDNSVNEKARKFFVDNYIPVAVVGGFFVVVFPILLYLYYKYQVRLREKQEEQRRKLHVSNSKLARRLNEKKGKSKSPYGNSPGSDSDGNMSPGSPGSGDSDSDPGVAKRRGNKNLGSDDDLENGSVSSKVQRQKANIKKIDAEISKINYMGINREEAEDIKAEQPEHQLFLDFLSVLVTSDVQKAIKNLTKFNGTLRQKLNLPLRSIPPKIVELLDMSEREVTSKNMTEMRKYAYELFVENETLRKKSAMVSSPSQKSVVSQSGPQNFNNSGRSDDRSVAGSQAGTARPQLTATKPLISQKASALPSKVSARGNNYDSTNAAPNSIKNVAASSNNQEPYEPYMPSDQVSKRAASPPNNSAQYQTSRSTSPVNSSNQLPSISLKNIAGASSTPMNRTAPMALGGSQSGNSDSGKIPLSNLINRSLDRQASGGITIGSRPKISSGATPTSTTPSALNVGKPSVERTIPSLRLAQTPNYTDINKNNNNNNSINNNSVSSLPTPPGIRSLVSASQSTRVLSPPLAVSQANQQSTQNPQRIQMASLSSRGPSGLNISTAPGVGLNNSGKSPAFISSASARSITPTNNSNNANETASLASNQIGVSNDMAYRNNPLANKARALSSSKVPDRSTSPIESAGMASMKTPTQSSTTLRSISTPKVNIATRGVSSRM